MAVCSRRSPADAVERLPSQLKRAGADVAAVCLLHSYVNPAHEQAIAARLRAAGWLVSVSSEVLPEYREFERWSTTVVNAYVSPLIDRYLARLEQGLPGRKLAIMQSNGGSISATLARTQAVRTVLSGPAAGVVGAQAVAARRRFRPHHFVRHGRHVHRREPGRSCDSTIDGLAHR